MKMSNKGSDMMEEWQWVISSIQVKLTNGVKAGRISKKSENKVNAWCEITVCLEKQRTLDHFLRETWQVMEYYTSC